ncbi:MAG: lactonase family protein [Chitinophagaceae bacterium]
MKPIILSLVSLLLIGSVTGQEHYLIAGTYNSPKSEGIYVYKFNSNDGSSKEISHIKTSNPSFVAISPDQKFVYAVHEIANNNNGGEVAAFSFNKKNGVLTFINQQLTGGDHPCYVELDKTGKWLLVANYTSGSFSVLPVNKDGSLRVATTTIQHTGYGKIPGRQSGPHAHCAMLSADNRWLFVPDLGMDKVMIYSFDAKTGKVVAAKEPFAASEPGSGPRHFAFHPNNKFAYLVEEISGSVVSFKYNNGTLKSIQRISSLPVGDTGLIGSADIHVSADGKFLYASNRGKEGSNTIAIFKIDPATGMLRSIGHQSTLGKIPRNFNFDPSGNFLLVANQESDDVVIFKRNKITGLLTDSGKRINVGKPVCLKWMAIK